MTEAEWLAVSSAHLPCAHPSRVTGKTQEKDRGIERD
jgi:hypothetical protein